MSDDLISRQAAIEAIEKNACNTQRIFDAVKALPPVKPKRWKWCRIKGTGLAMCDCGLMTDRYLVYKFCPNCGADMREVTE